MTYAGASLWLGKLVVMVVVTLLRVVTMVKGVTMVEATIISLALWMGNTFDN